MIPLKDGDLMLNLHSESQGRILSLKSSDIALVIT